MLDSWVAPGQNYPSADLGFEIPITVILDNLLTQPSRRGLQLVTLRSGLSAVYTTHPQFTWIRN
jgi:hypothetical protein